jgi:hypothetical protein
MRVRAHVGGTRQSLRQVNRPEMIEEDERPHHVTGRVRQQPADFEVAEIPASLVYQNCAHTPILLSPCVRPHAALGWCAAATSTLQTIVWTSRPLEGPRHATCRTAPDPAAPLAIGRRGHCSHPAQ